MIQNHLMVLWNYRYIVIMFLYPAPLSCFLTFALCVKLAINNSCLETQCSRSLCHYCVMCYDIVFVGCRGHGAGERHVCHLGWEGAWTQTLWHFPSRTPGAVCSCKWASALWSPVITYDLLWSYVISGDPTLTWTSLCLRRHMYYSQPQTVTNRNSRPEWRILNLEDVSLTEP